MIRIGQGFDVHAFNQGDHIVLGGVRIEHTRGVDAHSDGDVVLHALCDALLGCLALGDIGVHFPPSDPQWANADSRMFLRAVHDMISERGYRIVNVDVTVMCEAPKVKPHAQAIQKCIADDLQIGVLDVSIKATTTERLGFTGREEGIAALAVALIESA